MTEYTGNLLVTCEGRTEIMSVDDFITIVCCGDEFTVRLQKKDEVEQ